MIDNATRDQLTIDRKLAEFLETEVLHSLGRDPDAFWAGFAQLLAEFAPRNRQLLEHRDHLQREIDGWHQQRRGQDHDPAAYRKFLERDRLSGARAC